MKHINIPIIFLLCMMLYGCGSKEERLIKACQQGQYDTLIKLLKKGADKNFQTEKDGMTCLMAAAGNGQMKIVEKMLALRANSTLTDKDGNTAIDYATYYKHEAIANMIREHQDIQHVASISEQEKQQIFFEIIQTHESENNNISSVLSKYDLNERQANLIQQEGQKNDWILARPTPIPTPTPIPQLPSAKIVKDESYETPGKAQVEYHILVGEKHLSKETLTLLLQQFYEKATKVRGWKYHAKPTVIAIYMYTSKQHLESNSRTNIAEITKIPSNSEPELKFHEGQLRNIGKPQEEKWGISEEQRRYVYGLIGQAEMRAIKEADKAFPDFGEGHMEMVDMLTKKYYEEIMQKYTLTEDQFFEIIPEGIEKNWPSFRWEAE